MDRPTRTSREAAAFLGGSKKGCRDGSFEPSAQPSPEAAAAPLAAGCACWLMLRVAAGAPPAATKDIGRRIPPAATAPAEDAPRPRLCAVPSAVWFALCAYASKILTCASSAPTERSWERSHEAASAFAASVSSVRGTKPELNSCTSFDSRGSLPCFLPTVLRGVAA